jgi:tripartite-type tricarboxylate transporter receptor subunit TctC
MQRHCMRAASLLLLLVAAADARAQADYPDRPVRMISDSSPGSAVDTGLRIIADGMSKHWSQQVVLVNQPGAAGAISAQVAAQAAADGYTLYAPALSVFLAVPGKAPNLPLMVPRDFAAVGYTVDQPLAVTVSPKVGTVPGLIASGWQAVLTPNGTPEPIIAKASEVLRAALDMPSVKEPLATRGSFVRPMSPAEVTAFIHDQQQLWKPAIERIAQQMK